MSKPFDAAGWDDKYVRRNINGTAGEKLLSPKSHSESAYLGDFEDTVRKCPSEATEPQSKYPLEGGTTSEDTEASEVSEVLRDSEVSEGHRDSETAAIYATIPTDPRAYKRCLFEFVRRLKGMPYLCHADGRDIIDRAERWHRLASSAIPGLELEDVVARFYAAWTKVKFADGEGPLAQAMARALRRTPPQLPPGYQCEGLIHLAGLCRELQREAGDKPFYLSWRAAAAVLGLGKNSRQAGRWFFVLQAKGILQEHEKGSLESGKASEYRYLLPL